MTGTIQKPTPTLVVHKAQGTLELTFTNASGARLEAGHTVVLSNNMAVGKRATASANTFPTGVVTVGGEDGEQVTVATPFAMVQKAVAKGGTLAVNALLVSNGNIDATSKVPEYVAASTGDYANAVVLSGGAVDAEILVGILHTPIKA